MTLGLEAVPDWPAVTAVVRDDGTAEVTVNGTSHPVVASTVDRARAAVLAHVSEQTAGPLGRPVRIATTDPDGSWQLIVHPDGRVDPADTGGPAKQPRPFAPVAKAKRRLARPAVPPAAAGPAPPPRRRRLLHLCRCRRCKTSSRPVPARTSGRPPPVGKAGYAG